jgi:hypothetical protein
MKKYFSLSLVLSALALSACSGAAIKKHEPNFKNVRELEKVKGKFHVADVVAKATAVEKGKEKDTELEKKLRASSLKCRLTTFSMPVNTTVAQFIKNSLTDELDAAQKLSPTASAITVTVNQLESDTGGFGKGTWTLDFDYRVDNKNYNARTVTEFESAYAAATACRNTAEALTDALGQNFSALYKKLPH